MFVNIDSDGGYLAAGNFSIVWGNSEDPFFAGERLEGFFSIGYGTVALEFGAIDQDRPGIYLTTYKDDDIELVKPLVQL